MIPGAVATVNELQKVRKLKIGSTTGFTTPMVDILKKAASAQGYNPDSTVAADEVPQARPFPFMVWQNAIRLNVSPIAAIVKVRHSVHPRRRMLSHLSKRSTCVLTCWLLLLCFEVDDTADGVLEGITAGCWSVGLARSGNYMGMNEQELDDLENQDPEQYERMLKRSYEILAGAGGQRWANRRCMQQHVHTAQVEQIWDSHLLTLLLLWFSAHYVIDDINGLPRVIDDINRRLANGESP
jgi:phosphonoacetaldehyde hydrolase